jgi:hypothetical protein
MAGDRTQTIGLLANREMRNGPGSPMARFIREFEPYIREVLKPRICVLEGTYRALLRYGLLQGYKELYCVGSGYQGGIVTMTNMVVSTNAASGISRVIYFIDPRDPTSIFPESVALKRECVVAGKPFIATYAGACEWASLGWHNARGMGGE